MTKEIELNIIDFIRHPGLLNDQSLSETQITVLRVIYGQPLTDSELEIYRRGTGRESYDPKEHRETTIIGGRRGGKTRLSAMMTIYEAFRAHGLPPGEQGYVMLLARNKDQAQVAFRYIYKYLSASPILSKRIVNKTKHEIVLDNNIIIGCYACTHDGVRGRSLVAVICDEIGFWADGDAVANPAEEVLAALRPGMATVRNAKLIKISTPFVKVGILWDEFSRRNELDFPVWQLTSFQMNPSVREEDFESERSMGEEKFRREYLAQFTDSVNSWIDSDSLNRCIIGGRRELARQDNVSYVAVLDAASRNDDFALVIVHKDSQGLIVVDFVKTWTGTKKAPLQFETVLSEVKDILETYDTTTVTGDQYQADPISQHLLKLGIMFNLFTFSTATRFKIFSGLKFLLLQGKIQLLDDVELNRQLRSLREEKSPRGNVDVQVSSGKDDRAVALALAVHKANEDKRPLPFEIALGDMHFSAAFFGQIPGNCNKEAVCMNDPDCRDVGYCLGFKDARLSPLYPVSKISGP
jgi:phage terminase large subunit-like protein